MPNRTTPPSSTSSNGASPDAQQFRVVRKRNRIPLSCAPCRHRKLKCNRAQPCDNCTKRGDTSSCSYATPGVRRRGAAAISNSSPEDMQNRIDRLEGLVLSLMSTGGSQPSNPATARAVIDGSRNNSLSAGSLPRGDVDDGDIIPDGDGDGEGEDSEVEQVSKGIGVMKVDGNGRTVFASDSHWYAILSEISEVKKYFESHKEEHSRHIAKIKAAKADESPGVAFLLSGKPPPDRSDILAGFPSKADTDRLIARYFNAYDPSVHVIHGPSFQKRYDKHWLNPKESSIAWIGMAYAMITLAFQSYHRAGDEPPEYKGRTMELSNHFRRLTAHCLTLSDITMPNAEILETLVLYIQTEYHRSKDAEPGVLLLTSFCVRLAMRMGYHRDPGPHNQITPFQGEMRRRVFTFVRQCDLLISFQFGLPAMIRHEHIDSQPPRNLYDDELYEEMTTLPPSRPIIEATPMSYMIAKSKMTSIFGQIVERVCSITNRPTYEEIMRLDRSLRDARELHPPLLRMRSFQESARDPANLIMQRIALEMVFLRSLFVLHRRFIARGRENPRYAYSRRTCIDASMQLLAHQSTLYQESQPGGRLRSVKWYISSLTTHDFLLAAMLVCLDLYHMAQAEYKSRISLSRPSPSIGDHASSEVREEMLRAVEQCIVIWDSIRNVSMEAYKASGALRVMVEKLKGHQRWMAESQTPATTISNRSGSTTSASVSTREQPGFIFDLNVRSAFGVFPNGNISELNADDLAPEQSAAMTLGMLSTGGLSPGPKFGLNTTSPRSTSGSGGVAVGGTVPQFGDEHTGLTPSYTGQETNGNAATTLSSGVGGAVSPFSSMFSQGVGLQGMDGVAGDIDWSIWDNYIASNTAMDPSLSTWPMNLDFGSVDTTQNGSFGGVNVSTTPAQTNGANDAGDVDPGRGIY